MRWQPRIVRLAAALWLMLMLGGCAVGMNYDELAEQLRPERCPAGVAFMDKSKDLYGKNARLVYMLDSAMARTVCGDYAGSNQRLHDAEALAEQLWTKSVTKEAASFITNEYAIPYEGEDFEKALINVFSALNYAMLRDYEGALVECRKLDQRLNLLNDKHETKSVYKQDAFGRYLSAMLYEASSPLNLENLDHAYIDYQKAVQAYRDYEKSYATAMPRALVEDFLRVAAATGRSEDAKKLIGNNKNNSSMSQKEAASLARIVLVQLNGKGPRKVEDSIEFVPELGPYKMAFPKFVTTPPACQSGALLADGSRGAGYKAYLERVEDINRIAVKDLEDRQGRVLLKAAARFIAKQALIDAAAQGIDDKGSREAVKLLLNIVNMGMELADTRQWGSLPGEISLARAFVPPGEYRLTARLCNNADFPLGSMNLRAGETRFVILPTLY